MSFQSRTVFIYTEFWNVPNALTSIPLGSFLTNLNSLLINSTFFFLINPFAGANPDCHVGRERTAQYSRRTIWEGSQKLTCQASPSSTWRSLTRNNSAGVLNYVSNYSFLYLLLKNKKLQTCILYNLSAISVRVCR